MSRSSPTSLMVAATVLSRATGQAQRERRRPDAPANAATRYRPQIGIAYVHTVIDDHSRDGLRRDLHRREGRDRDRCPATGGGLVRRPRRHRRTSAVRQRVGLPIYAWRDACAELGITHKRTRPYRPRPTARSSDSTAHWPTAGPTPALRVNEQRNDALTGVAALLQSPPRPLRLGGKPPVTRLTNLPGHHT